MHPAFDLTGKTAIVTGASRGLGREMALSLARCGANLVLTGRDVKALEEARRETEALGVKAVAEVVEVTDRASIDRMVERTVSTFGTIDILVNNAGIVSLQSFFELTEEEFSRLFDINVRGVFSCTQAVGKVMVEQRSGKVINIGSIGGVLGRSHEAAYASTKTALTGLTRCLAIEWARYNIQVNMVCPGIFATDINSDALADPEVRQRIERRIPVRRVGQPNELAPTVVYLASAGSNFLTGQTIVVDGGECIK